MAPLPPLHWLDTGSGSALFLIHGGFSNGPAAWGGQISSLRTYHRLLAPDRRGHGQSPIEPRPYTIEGDAADVIQMADLVGALRFHIVGHSYGGLVALETAIQSPPRVLSLHLIEPPYLALLSEDPEVQALDSRVREIQAEGEERGAEWTATEFFAAIGGRDGIERLRSGPMWPLIVREASRLLHEEYAGDYPAERLHLLRHTVPVQIYTGTRSHPALRKVARRLSDLIKEARLIDIPDAGHAVQASGDRFNRELLAATTSVG